MSLINEMLRDLEQRRKVDGSAVKTTPAPTNEAGSSRMSRWFWLVLVGVGLGGAAWVGLQFLPHNARQPVAESSPQTVNPLLVEQQPKPAVAAQPSPPEAKGPQAVNPLPAKVVSSPVVAGQPKAKPAIKPATEPAVVKPSVAPKAEVVAKTSPPPKVPMQPAAVNIRSASGASYVELGSIGIVEGVDSIRLMFEFKELPAYQVKASEQDPTALSVTFVKSTKSSRLEIPPFRGPLLTIFELNAQQKDLHLQLQLSKPIQVQSYVLPADTFHGQRLLLELSEDREALAELRRQVQSTMGDRLRGQHGSAGQVVSPAEQAEIILRKGQRYLQQGNEGAAKSQFSKALALMPGNADLRMRLVELLRKRDKLEQAEDLLIAGLTLTPENPQLRTAYGQLLLDSNQIGEALELMLSKPIPALPDQPDYHALLAALEQESGKFANAATRYRELLQVRPEQADWWLMLGIAYEQLRDAKLAGSAYRQALERTGLSTEHRQFALERLERLQRISD